MPSLWTPPKPHIWTPPPGVLAERELERVALRGNHPSYRPNARRAETPGRLGASGASGIQFVGRAGDAQLAGTTCTVSLTSLSGGIASAAAEDDFVVVHTNNTGGGTTFTTSGYTDAHTELLGNDTYDCWYRTAYKFMTATPDTTFVCEGAGSTSHGITAIAFVYRGVDQTTPLDGVTPTTATGGNSIYANPPSITPTTAGAWIECGGGGACTSRNGDTYGSSDFDLFYSITADSFLDVPVGVGYFDGWTSGAFDPAAFTFTGSNGSQFSWAAASIVLRPAS